MDEPKRFDINKFENFLKNYAEKTQTLDYRNTAVDLGKLIEDIDENSACNHDDNQLAGNYEETMSFRSQKSSSRQTKMQ